MKLETSLLEGMALLIEFLHRSACGTDTPHEVRCSQLCARHGRRLTQILIDVGANSQMDELLSFMAYVKPEDESEEAEARRDAARARLHKIFPHLEAERTAAFQAARAAQNGEDRKESADGLAAVYPGARRR